MPLVEWICPFPLVGDGKQPNGVSVYLALVLMLMYSNGCHASFCNIIMFPWTISSKEILEISDLKVYILLSAS